MNPLSQTRESGKENMGLSKGRERTEWEVRVLINPNLASLIPLWYVDDTELCADLQDPIPLSLQTLRPTIAALHSRC